MTDKSRKNIAAIVTNRAVSSYPTISPLPNWAVYFLLHFPKAYACQELPGFIFQWSPDFPLDCSSDHRTILFFKYWKI